MIVYSPPQQRNLYDDAVVHETVYKRIRYSLCHDIAIVVIRIVVDIYHRFFDIPHPMPEQINGNHRYGIALLAVFLYIVLVAVLRTKILAEA